ncbi:tyrosine-type recombinase/integrase [Aeromonas caviae]
MALKPLTDSAVKMAKFDPNTPANNTRRDGSGLELRISKSSKSWVFKYVSPASGKRTNMGFGQYPDVGLALARQMRQDARALLAQGIDPAADRKARQEAEKAAQVNTFGALVAQLMELKAAEHTPKHCGEVQARFDLHILPGLGKVQIADIRAPAVIAMLRPLEAAGKLDTLKRCCANINEVMTYAVNFGLIDANPCAGIKQVFKKVKRENNPHLPMEGITELVAAIDAGSMEFLTKCALLLQLHTLTRPAETAGARWDEINEEARTWTIPAGRMKAGKEHIIPLTDSTLALLAELRPLTGRREHLFPNRGKPLEHMHPSTLNITLKRLGFQDRQTAHGVRALGSTTLNEAGFNHMVVEAALAHGLQDKVAASYNHANHIAQRVIMMAWWSAHIERARAGVFNLEAGRRGLELVA